MKRVVLTVRMTFGYILVMYITVINVQIKLMEATNLRY